MPTTRYQQFIEELLEAWKRVRHAEQGSPPPTEQIPLVSPSGQLKVNVQEALEALLATEYMRLPELVNKKHRPDVLLLCDYAKQLLDSLGELSPGMPARTVLNFRKATLRFAESTAMRQSTNRVDESLPGDTGDDAPTQASETTPDHSDEVTRAEIGHLAPSVAKALRQRHYAQEEGRTNKVEPFPEDQAGDQQAYTWLKNNCDQEGQQPTANYAAFARYLRSARKASGLSPGPRRGRATGSSIAKPDQL